MKLNLRDLKARVIDGLVQEVDFGELGKAKLIFRADRMGQVRKLWQLRAALAKGEGVKPNELELSPDFVEAAVESNIGTIFLGWTDDTEIEFGEGQPLKSRTESGDLDEDALRLFLSLPTVRNKVLGAIGEFMKAEEAEAEGKGKRSSSKSSGK